MSSDIFYKARQLRKKNRIKDAWFKLGTIYIRKDDESQAFNIQSVQQLLQFEKQLLSEESDPHDSGSAVVANWRRKQKQTQWTHAQASQSKLDRSYSEPSRISKKKSPRHVQSVCRPDRKQIEKLVKISDSVNQLDITNLVSYI